MLESKHKASKKGESGGDGAVGAKPSDTELD
jgi:hypothetical protein